MIGPKRRDSGDGVVLHHGKLVSIRPAVDGIACQPLNPSVQLYRPRGNVAALYVADHGSPGVTGGMMTCLETLDAARGAKAAVEIFSLIAVGSGRRRQPFAFNGKQRLIFRIMAAFDPATRFARRNRKIDRSSAVGVVRFFALEIQKIPSRGMTADRKRVGVG